MNYLQFDVLNWSVLVNISIGCKSHKNLIAVAKLLFILYGESRVTYVI